MYLALWIIAILLTCAVGACLRLIAEEREVQAECRRVFDGNKRK